jgi:lipoyl(octanoyl) transferase
VNAVINRKARFEDLGLMDYQQAWDYQTRLFQQTLDVKLANRSLPPERQRPTDNHVLFVEHPHVYTLGRNGNANNLLIAEKELAKIGATYYPINRGGDITYHGPGQIVGYPVLDLENFFTDIHRYMRSLEEAVILTLAEFSITAQRINGLTGVWVPNGATPCKICALGVKTSRWVTMHGFALNVNTDLKYFNHIIPCGINDKQVTSMADVLGSPQDIRAVATRLRDNIARVFGIEWLD